MLSFLPGFIRGIMGIIFLIVNLLFWFSLLLPFAIIKLLFPFKKIRKPMNVALNFLCTRWSSCNKAFLMLLNDIRWDVDIRENLSTNNWYLVLANHQSWSDIVVLQFVFNRRIPFFRFFLKQQLAWIPIFNFAWYALDYPYMKRYSKEFIEKHPHLKGKDIETTRRSCRRFKDTPVAVMNFVEGTRFTSEKRQKQKSPFTHLLKPKAGGIAFVLSAMGDLISTILDVTISYEPKVEGLWGFLCGRVTRVKVRVDHIDITNEILGNYFEDEAFRLNFQNWVNQLWTNKDGVLEKLRNA